MKLPKFFTPQKIATGFLLLLLLLTILTYLPCLSSELVDWDDQFQVSNNLDIKSLSLISVQKIFTNFYAGMYQPLATLSFALENKFWHSFPLFLHLDNLLLHLFNIVLIYCLTKKLFKKYSIALISSAYFALHPLQVETVAWISARSNLLYTSFFLLALIAYTNYCQNQKIKNYLLTLGCFILALLSKAPAVMMPLILPFLDYYYYRPLCLVNGQKNKKLLLEKIPFLVLSVIFGWLTIKGRDLNNSVLPTAYSWLDKLTFITYSPLSYLQKILFPYNLSAFYALPEKTNGHLPIIFYLSIPIFFGLIFLIFKYRQKRNLILGVTWFLLLVLPSIQIKTFSTTITADRYAYLSELGIFWLISLAVLFIYTRFKNLRTLLLLALLINFIFLAIQTNNQARIWKNSTALWTDVIAHNPKSINAYINLGNAKAKNNDTAGAMEAYNQALEFNQQDPYVLNNIGALLAEKMSRYPEALDYYNRAVVINPNEALFYYNRACALLKLNQLPEALKDYQTAVKLKSSEKFYNFSYLNGLASLEYRLKYFQEAAKDYTQIIQNEPQLAEPYFFRGLIRITLKNKNLGCQDLQKAERLGYQDKEKNLETYCR